MPTIHFKRKALIGVLILVLIFTTKFFESTPFETLFFQVHAVFLGLILLFILFYSSDVLLKKKPISKVVLYFMVLILILPIYSAYRSHVEFGQPYLYGILSQRGWLVIGVGILFYYILTTNKVTFSIIESSFLFMSWGSLLIFLLLPLVYDPSQLSEESSFVLRSEARGVHFKFQNFFITFGSFYYFIKYSMYKKQKDLLILLIFLAYVVFVIQGRTYMMTLLVTFLLYYYFNYPLYKFILNIIKVTFFLISILIIIKIVVPEYIDMMVNLFIDMFTVLGGKDSEDMSANARIWQSVTVLNYFEIHPLSIWLGTGVVSNQWNEGYKSLFGYFYPEDIGLLGGIFLYGIVGMIFLLVIPLILEIKEIKKATNKKNVFIVTIKYMLILSILGFLQGGFYFGANIWVVLFFILFAYNHINRRAIGKL